jgi:hypothetical protein
MPITPRVPRHDNGHEHDMSIRGKTFCREVHKRQEEEDKKEEEKENEKRT